MEGREGVSWELGPVSRSLPSLPSSTHAVPAVVPAVAPTFPATRGQPGAGGQQGCGGGRGGGRGWVCGVIPTGGLCMLALVGAA